MRSIKSLLLYGVCSISIAVVSMGQSQAAGALLPELTSTSLRRVVAHKMVFPTQAFLQRRFSSSSHQPQVYGIATYDALFKYILSDAKIRPSFFHAFIPNLPIVSSERLDEHMNPVQSLQLLRDFLHSKNTERVINGLKPDSSFEVARRNSVTKDLEIDDEATTFLHEMVKKFEEIKKSFPRAKYDGTMDFVCQLANKDYALVEMQVIPENCWDRRALAYVAAFYGNQLFKGGEWRHIRKVIGVNILGGGKEDKEHWVDTPKQFVRHYKVQEQLNNPTRYMDGIEIIQYSIMHAPKVLPDRERSDWVTFFKEGHYMSEDDVQKRIETPAVLEAFQLAKIKLLPAEVLATYEAEDHEYDRYSQHTESLVQQGALKGEVKALVGLIKAGKITVEDIIQNGDYSDEVKAELKKQL